MMVAVCWILSACGQPRSATSIEELTPDQAVTTLLTNEIAIIGKIVQLQGVIYMAGNLARQRAVLPGLHDLTEAVMTAQREREGDLRLLITLKHAPEPADLGQEYTELLDDLRAAPTTTWETTMVGVYREIHQRLSEIFVQGQEQATDPELRDFIAAQTLPLQRLILTLHKPLR
jgi:predicted outer membrane protein